MESTQELNTEELMHLALYETRKGSTEKAIAHLKRLIEINPQSGNAHYLLGALHAEIGMYDQAKEEMEHALDLNPDLTTARFQLGLLYITSREVSQAEQVWQKLNELGEEHPLFLFKSGMLHLAKDEFEACITKLNAGIQANDFNEDLNEDMRKTLNRAREAQKQRESEKIFSTSSNEDQEPSENNSKQRLLSKYGEQENG